MTIFKRPTLLRTAFAVSFVLLATLSSAQDAGLGSPEDQRNLIAGICGTQLTLGAEGCRCLADRAATGLDEAQRAYLILSVVQPPAAERLAIARSKVELAAIFRFLETARDECAPAAAPKPAPADAPTGEGAAPAQPNPQ